MRLERNQVYQSELASKAFKILNEVMDEIYLRAGEMIEASMISLKLTEDIVKHSYS